MNLPIPLAQSAVGHIRLAPVAVLVATPLVIGREDQLAEARVQEHGMSDAEAGR